MWIKNHKARKVISNESSCKPSNKMMGALPNATSSFDFASPITPSCKEPLGWWGIPKNKIKNKNC